MSPCKPSGAGARLEEVETTHGDFRIIVVNLINNSGYRIYVFFSHLLNSKYITTYMERCFAYYAVLKDI